MKTKTILVGVKLTPTEHAAVKQLAAKTYRGTLSGVIREAIMRLLEEEKLSFEAKLKIRQERITHKGRKAKDWKPE